MVRVIVRRPVRLTVRFHLMTMKTTLLPKRCHQSNLRSPRNVQQRPREMIPRRARRPQNNEQWRKDCVVPRVRPRIGAFCAIIKNIEANHESGTNDLDVYHKACAEYKMIYKGDFNLEHCYNIVKDHSGWTDVEMPYFYQTQGRKKSKTSETTSGSTSGGINSNEKANEVVQETQEFRPMGRDRAKAKKKAAGSSSRGSSSFVDLVVDKFYNMKQKREKKDKEQQSYIDLKNRELSIQEDEAREIAQLKREKLEIQRRMLELAESEKRDTDILFYNSVIDPNFPPIIQQKLLEMKMEIKARYNLDY
nr:hypothetical protein [Tanacetum cinerariifolium]